MRVLIFLFFLCKVCYGQTVDNFSNFATLGITRFNNFQALGQKNVEAIDYSEIRGNCFWDAEWSSALLVLKSGSGIKLKNVKLNLYTNNVHYLDNKGSELVALTNPSKVIFFDKKDTTKVSAVFQSFASFKEENKESFGQVLAGNDVQLVKNFIISLNKEYDRVNAETDYRFRTFVEYSIIDHGNKSPLKSINKAAILSIIKPTKEQEEWLQANKNKLKSEADAIAFITFCNSLQAR